MRVLPAAFRFRLANRRDLETCVNLLPPELNLGRQLRTKVIDLWTDLIANRAPTFIVVEDLTRPHPDGIEAFGASAFVSRRFAEEYCAAPTPYLDALVYERMLTRDGSVLDRREIREANSSSGLHLTVLHFGLRNEDMNDPRTMQALQIGSAAFFHCHTGYRIELLMNEVFGEQHKQFMEAGGFRLQRYVDGRHADLAADAQPYLFVLKKAWAPPGAVNPLAQIFRTPLPAIYFAPAEQRVLTRALLNDADAAIAESLGISPDTVKKTWRAIFERVERHAPFIVPHGRTSIQGRRSQEKRRHLLEYLRTHLEELRPFERPREASSRQTPSTPAASRSKKSSSG